MSRFLVNGAFQSGSLPPLDDAEVESLLTTIGAARSRALEGSVRNESIENRAGNARVNLLNQVLNELRVAQPEKDEKDQVVRGGRLPQTANFEIFRNLRILDRDGNGVSFYDAFLFRNDDNNDALRQNGDYQRLTENVRAVIDQVSSDSQLNLIRLQGMINRNNQALEFVTNAVQKFNDVESRINPNFRQ
jgi:hypothetical protein